MPTHRINTAEIFDRGFVGRTRWDDLESQAEDAVGNRQCVALIEGITHEESSADDSPWFTNPEKPGRAITIAAENLADLEAAVEWVREHYDVFTVHVETDELHAPEADETEARGEDGSPSMTDEQREFLLGYERHPHRRVELYSAYHREGVSTTAGAWEGMSEAQAARVIARLAKPELPTEPEAQADFLDALDAKVREVSYDAVERALLRFPNDAAAALRYASALLAVAAEEV